MSYYTVKACETLMRKYVEKGGTCCTVEKVVLDLEQSYAMEKDLKLQSSRSTIKMNGLPYIQYVCTKRCLQNTRNLLKKQKEMSHENR